MTPFWRGPFRSLVSLVSLVLSLLCLLCALTGGTHAAHADKPAGQGSRRPLIAVWCADKGLGTTDAPYLRVAVWNDGRVLFAPDPQKWSHTLRQGKLSPARLADLKKRIAATGVFSLKGTSYLVPDADMDGLLVDFGTRRQMLYWDEVEMANYGANTNPSPTYLTFKKCWKALNRILTESLPKKSEASTVRFDRVPRAWYVKPSIQGE